MKNLGISFLAACVALSATAAQEKAPPAETTTEERQEKATALETVVVTADKISRPTQTIDSKDLERRTPRSLEEALQYTSGVQANSRGGDDVRVSLRGSGLHSVVFTKQRGTEVFLNGFSINSADGTLDYGLISPAMAEALDVYMGGEAQRLGSTTLGGALNLISPTGRTAVNKLRLDGGSFGFIRGMGSLGVAGESWDAALQFDVKREDGFRDFSKGDAQKAAFNFGNQFTKNLSNRIYVNFARVNQDVSLPITQTELEANPRQGRVNGPPGNFNINSLYKPFYTTNSIFVGDRLTYALGEKSNLEFQVQYQFKDIDFRRPGIPAPPMVASQRGPGWLNAQTHDIGSQLRYVNQGTLAGRENAFTAGLRSAGMWGKETLAPNLQTIKGNKFADGDLFASNTVFFADNRWRVANPLFLNATVNGFYAQRNYKDKMNAGAGGTNVSKNQDYSGVTTRLGADFVFLETNTLFAAYSRNIEPPAFGDLIMIPVPGPAPVVPQRIDVQNLNAQKAHVAEGGYKHKSKYLTFQTTGYLSWLKDEIIRYNPNPGVATVGNQTGVNAPKTRHYGIESVVALTLPLVGKHALRVQGQYTWRENRFDSDKDYGNNLLAGVPTMLLAGELLYQFDSMFYIGPTITATPVSYYADNANTIKANGYYLLGVRAGFSAGPFSVYLEGRNLTNEAYVANLQPELNAAGADQSVYFPGEGRSFYAGAEWRL